MMNSGFKINIGLHITERMSNGFHRIESIFYPVDLIEDSVKITPQAGETTLEVVGADFTCEMEKNLCVKAYRLLEKDFGNKYFFNDTILIRFDWVKCFHCFDQCDSIQIGRAHV